MRKLSVDKQDDVEDIYDSIKEKCGGKQHSLRFPVYMSERLMDASIEELDLNQRPYNCLMRNNYYTVGDVVENINGETDLLAMRNMGAVSAKQIMKSLFLFQYRLLSPEKQESFLKRVLELNA